MKTIVFVNGKPYSAWHNEKEAKKQIEILKKNGYKNCYYDFIDHNYENGHHFVFFFNRLCC